jgi:hypothetical protein
MKKYCTWEDHKDGRATWILQDKRGISCGRVCAECEDTVRAKYRPEIFTNSRYSMPEDDLYWGGMAEDSDDY